MHILWDLERAFVNHIIELPLALVLFLAFAESKTIIMTEPEAEVFTTKLEEIQKAEQRKKNPNFWFIFNFLDFFGLYPHKIRRNSLAYILHLIFAINSL